MHFAFGVADFLSNELSADAYLDYGTVKVYYESWNETWNDLEPIPMRPCTEQDFGIGNTPEQPQIFFEIFQEKRNELIRKIPILQCTRNSISLQGNFNTARARVLEMYFERCDSKVRRTCKSNTEVKEWLKDKYIWFAYNRQ
jgi:hypothetical protein